MTVPQNVSRAQRDHPRVYCAEDDCGHLLATTRFPRDVACPWCGGFKRRYEYSLQAWVETNPQLTTTRTFYQRHPGWLAVQLVIIAACLVFGVVGLIFGLVASIAGLVGGALLGLVALLLPGWKDRVEERRLTSG
jgi:hypothetical protein